MEMVVIFELVNNFFWVHMIVLNVIYWEGIDRLELTRQGAFENTKLANIIRKIRDRLDDKRSDDWQFWLAHPPYLLPYPVFTSKLAQITERLKNNPKISRKPGPGVPVMNEWYYLAAEGNLFSQFMNGTRVNYPFQPVEKIQQWVKSWNPWSLIAASDWNARRGQTKVTASTMSHTVITF